MNFFVFSVNEVPSVSRIHYLYVPFDGSLEEYTGDGEECLESWTMTKKRKQKSYEEAKSTI